MANGGIVAPKGPAGSMILFHGCLVHASTSNLSPWNRVSVYLSLCAVSNHIRRFKRPGYIAHRDFSPIQCLPDDCLLEAIRRAAALEERHAPGRTEGCINTNQGQTTIFRLSKKRGLSLFLRCL